MHRSTYAVVVLALVGAIVFAGAFSRAFWYAPETEIELPDATKSQATGDVALPARLHIPSLGIEAQVQHVGITAKGNMAAPSNYSDVGWYKYGTVPGTRGSAVIAGHVDNGLGLPGVFKKLRTLKAGEEFILETETGEELRFVIEDIQTYPYKEVSGTLLFNRDDVARLNLITCEGSWVGADRTYDERLVVFAKLAED